MKTGSILALIGGILIMLNSILVVAAFYSGMVFMMGISISSSFLLSLGAIGLLSGILVLLGAYLSLKSRTSQTGGLLVVIFSAISFLGGGGFIVGSVLGIIGGAFILEKK